MNIRERVLARRELILETVKAGGATTKSIAKELGVTTETVRCDIHLMNNIHWQDDILYYGERL